VFYITAISRSCAASTHNCCPITHRRPASADLAKWMFVILRDITYDFAMPAANNGLRRERQMSAAISFLEGRITIDPDICNGKPTIRGKRITVQTVLEFLAAGDSEEEILSQYPSLEAADIKACLTCAARLMNERYELSRVA
jgi:uncharacterized protein (DUF433 family)